MVSLNLGEFVYSLETDRWRHEKPLYSGGLKDFFDRTYYATKEQVTDKPCAIFVTHGGGGRAVSSTTLDIAPTLCAPSIATTA